MKTEEDEAFDDIARRQGAWGGGFPAKRQMAMDKINSEFRKEYIKYRTAFPKEYTAPQPAQEHDAYQSGFYDGKKAARARCIELVLAGSSMPVQTRTLEALQRDRKRIAALIEEDGK